MGIPGAQALEQAGGGSTAALRGEFAANSRTRSRSISATKKMIKNVLGGDGPLQNEMNMMLT